MTIFDRMVAYCEKYNVINENQFGFQKKPNTACAIISILEYLQTRLDKLKNSVRACIDLKKAFDTIPHLILLEKLSNMGFRGK